MFDYADGKLVKKWRIIANIYNDQQSAISHT